MFAVIAGNRIGEPARLVKEEYSRSLTAIRKRRNRWQPGRQMRRKSEWRSTNHWTLPLRSRWLGERLNLANMFAQRTVSRSSSHLIRLFRSRKRHRAEN